MKSPMLPPLTRDEVRSVDKAAIEQLGMSGLILMENAGRGAAELIHQVVPEGRIGIVCGRGNNAGDGYVIARHLQLLGREVCITSLVELEELSGDAAANAKIAVAGKIPIRRANTAAELAAAFRTAECLIDCMLGTGARGELREPYATAVSAANAAAVSRIAIDVPTGLDCDDGTANDPTFLANHTITFVAPKIGLLVESAAQFMGELYTAGIGVPRDFLESFAASIQRNR